MKKLYRILVVFVSMSVVSVTTVLADTATADTPVMTIFDDIVHFVGYTAGLVLMGLLGLLVKKIFDKYKVAVPQEWLYTAHGFIDQGIAYAQEQAKKRFAGTKLASSDKLNIAAKFVLDHTDDKKLLKMGEAKVKELIEARLNQVRGDAPTPTQVAIDAALKTEAKKPEGGFARVDTMCLIAFVMATLIGVGGVACTQMKNAGSAAAKDMVACTEASVKDRVSELVPTLVSLLTSHVDQTTGKVMWSEIKPATSALKSDIAGCALATAVRAFTNLTMGSGAQGLQVDQDVLLSGFDAIRKEQFGGKTFNVEGGAL